MFYFIVFIISIVGELVELIVSVRGMHALAHMRLTDNPVKSILSVYLSVGSQNQTKGTRFTHSVPSPIGPLCWLLILEIKHVF